MTQSLEAAARALVADLDALLMMPHHIAVHTKDLHAALAALPADAEPVQPVAWRVWSRHLQDWVLYTSSAAEAKAMGGVVEPLYAFPPSPDRTQGQSGVHLGTMCIGGHQFATAHVAAQADALAALAELVSAADAMDKVRGSPQQHEKLVANRLGKAWAEARRVIAATGGKK